MYHLVVHFVRAPTLSLSKRRQCKKAWAARRVATSLAFLLHLTAHTPPAWFLICAEGEARLCSTCGAASVGVARRRRVDGAKAAVGVLGGPRDCHGPFDALNDLRCQALDRVLALIDVVIQPFNAAEVRSLVVPTLS